MPMRPMEYPKYRKFCVLPPTDQTAVLRSQKKNEYRSFYKPFDVYCWAGAVKITAPAPIPAYCILPYLRHGVVFSLVSKDPLIGVPRVGKTLMFKYRQARARAPKVRCCRWTRYSWRCSGNSKSNWTRCPNCPEIAKTACIKYNTHEISFTGTRI